MKIFYGLFTYFFIGGLLMALAINHCYEETGKPATHVEWLEAAIWPMAFGMLAVSDEAYGVDACNQ